MAIWHKSVVSLIFWFDIINGQFVDPTKVKILSLRNGVMVYICSIFKACVSTSSPANVGDIYSVVRLDFCTILVPGSSHVLIRHLTLKNRLILCLDCEVCDALVDLQFFLYTVRKAETVEAFRLQGRCYCLRRRN